MDRTADFICVARKMRSEGLDLDDVLRQLRADGATIVESIKVIREVESIPLGQAKEVVDASVAWVDSFDRNDQIRASAIEAIDPDATVSKSPDE